MPARNIVEIIISAKDEASDKIGKFKDVLASLGVLAAAQKIAQVGIELGQLGQQSQAAEARFTAFAGSAAKADSILKAVNSTTGGTVGKMVAMTSATRLLSMGLASNADEVAALTQVALRLGDQTHEAGARIENFALLLANKSTPRLDSFGISAANVRARMKDLKVTMPGLTDDAAFMTATMAEGGIALERLGDAGIKATQGADRLAASSQNLKAAIGTQLAPMLSNFQTGLSAVFETLGNTQSAINGATEGMGWFGKRIAIALEGVDKLGGGMIEFNTVFDEYAEQQASAVEISERANTAIAGQAKSLIEEMIPATTDSAVAMDQYNAAIAATEASSVAMAVAQASLTEAMYENQAASDAVAAGISSMSEAQFVASQIDILREAVEAGTLSDLEFAEAQRILLLQSGELTRAEIEAQQKIEGLTGAFIDGKISAYEMAFGLNTTKDSIDALQNKKITVTIEQVVQTKGALTAAGLSEEEARSIMGPLGVPQETLAGGFDGVFSKPTNLMVGEAGTEKVSVQPMNSTTNNYNLNLTSGKSSGSVQQDFGLFRAFSGA